MWLITDWTAHSWELFQTRGWWFAVGLLLCMMVRYLPWKAEKCGFFLITIGLGGLLPVCNFAVIPVAIALRNRESGTGTALAFLSSAVLLNPACILSAWAYMGPKLAAAWSLSAVFVSLAVGVVTVLLLPREEKPDAASDWVSKIFSISVPELAFWLVLGILAQGLLQALAPKELWQNLLLNPSAASFGDAAAAGIFRHVCIPDDVALAASLAATGFPPGWVVLLLTAGICTNLPELFVLYGMAGKKTAVLYGVVSLCAGIAAGIMTQIAIGPGFVPQYSLAGAEPMIRIANLLSIRTWLPARIPCAVLLLLLALWRIWNRRGK